MKKDGGMSTANSAGIAGVVFGVLSIVLGFGILLGFFAGFVCGILGLVFALIQRKKSRNSWSRAGIILSIIGLVVNIFAFIVVVNWIAQVLAQIEQLQASGALA